MRRIIFFHGPDSPGIGAELTRVLFNRNCKIFSFRIFTISPFFSAAIDVECQCYIDLAELKELLNDTLKNFSVSVDILEPDKTSNINNLIEDEWIPYEISIICTDITKTLFYFFKEMASMKINIFDINCLNIESESFESYKIVAKIEVPLKISSKTLNGILTKIDSDLNTMSDISAINTLEM